MESGAHFLLVSFVAADATASLACSGMIRATDDSNRERRDSKASYDALIDVGDDGDVDEEGGICGGRGVPICHLHISEKSSTVRIVRTIYKVEIYGA